MRVALVPLDIKWNDKDFNRNTCSSIISVASSHEIDLIVFPEMTLTGFNMKPQETAENFSTSETISFFQKEAGRHGVAIIFGVTIIENNEYYNSACFIDKKGTLVDRYSKVHLFSHAHEDLEFQSGDELTRVTLDGIEIGLTICYDLRFPELYSALSETSELIVNIANWPIKRDLHWRTLLQARAIENQRVIIGVNRSGTDNLGEVFSGISTCTYPDGSIAEPLHSEMNFSIFEIDFDRATNFTNMFATRIDRRLDLYTKWGRKQ